MLHVLSLSNKWRGISDACPCQKVRVGQGTQFQNSPETEQVHALLFAK